MLFQVKDHDKFLNIHEVIDVRASLQKSLGFVALGYRGGNNSDCHETQDNSEVGKGIFYSGCLLACTCPADLLLKQLMLC